MRNNIVSIVALGALLSLSMNAIADDSNQLTLGPVSVSQDVQGIAVTITSTLHVDMHTTSSGLSLKMKVEADLSDLQSKIGPIIDTIPLPKDNCPSYKPDIPLPTISSKALQASGASAVLALKGYVDIWSCIQNPVPNSKVEMVIKKVGPIKTKVPEVVTWPGSPIKNKTLNQPFEVTEAAQVVKVDDHTVALQLGAPDVKLGGRFVFITKGILSLAGVDINTKAREALNKAIDASKLRVSVPNEILQYNPHIDGVSFQSVGPRLFVVMDLSADVPAEKITAVLKQLVDSAAKKP